MSLIQKLYRNFAYIKPGQVINQDCTYSAVPIKNNWFFIGDLENIRSFAKQNNFTLDIRFRGPRSDYYDVKGKYRNAYARAHHCMKTSARFFIITHINPK